MEEALMGIATDFLTLFLLNLTTPFLLNLTSISNPPQLLEGAGCVMNTAKQSINTRPMPDQYLTDVSTNIRSLFCSCLTASNPPLLLGGSDCSMNVQIAVRLGQPFGRRLHHYMTTIRRLFLPLVSHCTSDLSLLAAAGGGRMRISSH